MAADYAVVKRVRDYEFLGTPLGNGATSWVFRCRHRDRPEVLLAVKELRDIDHNCAVQKNFERERECLKGIQHPNVVRLHDHFVDKDDSSNTRSAYLILEFCPEGNLKNYFKKSREDRGFSEPEFMDFMGQIADGLDVIWDHKIIHRDIKTANVLVTIGKNDRSRYFWPERRPGEKREH